MALAWVASMAVSKNWRNLCFSSDSLEIVRAVYSTREPCGWNFREDILKMRQILQKNCWSLSWNARSSNRFADALEKETLSSNCNFSFCFSNLEKLPADLSTVLVTDMISGGSCL